ncbi:hypothetical protein FisN_30Hh028 [Fistulifera solaris]|uniref:Uncharacterized protein n=1 Tax=Fistulifera solaris TaxID=1519565 RepID=A0A1Z5K7D0_FISSO|nr:hypothetical protein FisN_30Hh028 [Fistulifera solaris]|eukprot:GAX21828.1 hypothetical protein FisN_30Hh028 [Fistulifera solaris]
MTTPDKVPCRGFQGDKVNDLFRQSLCTGPPYRVGCVFPKTLDLPACYPGAAQLEFRLLTDECMWILVAKSCEHEFDRHRNTRRCPACQQYKEVVKTVTRPPEIDVTKVQRLTERSYVQLAANPRKIKQLIDNIREQRSELVTELRRKIRKMDPSYDESGKSDGNFC